MAVSAGTDRWNDVSTFYIHAAWLLDDRKFHDWLDLLADDLFYYMPRKKNRQRKDVAREVTEYGDLALFEEDKESMKMRIAHLDTGMAWAEDPPSRTRHLISNLEVEDIGNDEMRARTAFMLYRTHLETDQGFFVGSRDERAARGQPRMEGGQARHRAGRQRHHGQEPQRLLLERLLPETETGHSPRRECPLPWEKHKDPRAERERGAKNDPEAGHGPQTMPAAGSGDSANDVVSVS